MKKRNTIGKRLTVLEAQFGLIIKALGIKVPGEKNKIKPKPMKAEIRIIKDNSIETNPFMYVETDCSRCNASYHTVYNAEDGSVDSPWCGSCERNERESGENTYD